MDRIDARIVAETGRSNLQEVFKRHAFGPFVLDARRLVLSVAAEPLSLGPRVVATLATLVERAGEVVTKGEILDRVWLDEDVGESNVAQSVYSLRKVLRDHGLPDAIATVPRRGYRFTAPVYIVAETVTAPHPLHRPPGGPAPRPRSPWVGILACLALFALANVTWEPAARQGSPLSARGAESYLLGRYYWNLRTVTDLAKSPALFAEVVAADPRSPLGYAALADADLMIADYESPRVRKATYYARARTEIRTALAIAPDSAAAHTSMAMLHYTAERDSRAADREFRRAIALDPSYALAHHWFGTTLLERGRVLEASRELHDAIALEPASPATSAWLAEASYYRHRYADAIAYSRRALDLDPRRAGELRRLGLAYEMAGNVPRAIAVFEHWRRSGSHDADDAYALLAEAYARAGRRDAARPALRDALRLHPDDPDTAFALLAAGDRARGLILLGKMNPVDDLQDPRVEPFRAALRDARATARTSG